MSAYTISASFLYPYEMEEYMEGLVTLCIHKKYISNRNVCTSPQHARNNCTNKYKTNKPGESQKKRGEQDKDSEWIYRTEEHKANSAANE